jgi:DNA repair photolyase
MLLKDAYSCVLEVVQQISPVDQVPTGDYQPAERKFKVSRRMLDVCLELGFPVFAVERSPLVLRDLDLLQAIDDRATAVVIFGIIYTPDSRHAAQVRRMERLASPPEKRFAAMEQLARAGILTGTCMMPARPGCATTTPACSTWSAGRRSMAASS